MRWPTWTPEFEYRIRIVLLAIAVLACVALPYAVIRSNAEAMMEASGWVVHSAEVKEKFNRLRLTLAEIESVILGEFAQMPRASGRADYGSVREEIDPLLAELSEATRDNIDQQNRIGALGALIGGRLKLYDEAMRYIQANNFDAAADRIRQAAELFDTGGYWAQIVAFENELYVQRTTRLARLERNSRWAMSSA